jgi:glycosyltransferase involved in cell wall biosynthesis
MKILYICGDQGIPVFGRKGASTHIREMIAAWRAQGHEVILAAPDLSGDRRPDEDLATITLSSPKSRLIGADGRYMLGNWQSLSILRGAVKRHEPDVIYERSALYFDAGQRLAAETRLPRILEVNALLSHEQEERLHLPRLAQRMERLLVNGAQGIAAISSVMKRTLVGLGAREEAVRVFTMAVDPERFQPTPEPNEWRQSLGWTNGEIVLGYVGSMNSYHHPRWYVELAEKILRREDQKIRFLVVGGSPNKVQRYRSRLAKYVQEGRIHFTGSVPQESMASLLMAMDAVLVPGASEQSTPTKIFECAALGRTLLLPGTEPITELCGPGSPLLFANEDFSAFEATVKRFCESPEPFRKAARELQQRILRDYTWASHARRLTDWFNELR